MGTTEIAIDALTAILAKRWQSASTKFIDLAAALPDDKFETELVNGARSYGSVLRHVAYWNRYVADGVHGRQVDDTGNELSADGFPDKAALLHELKKSNEEVAEGFTRPLDAEALPFIAMGLEHICEHYGQLAVYARLLNIVPPASRT